MIIVSEDVQRITGTYIADDRSVKPPLLAWVQAECRMGCFQQALQECIKNQPEPLRADLVTIESVDAEKIVVRVPGRVSDHESPSNFDVDVLFKLNPLTLGVERI